MRKLFWYRVRMYSYREDIFKDNYCKFGKTSTFATLFVSLSFLRQSILKSKDIMKEGDQ